MVIRICHKTFGEKEKRDSGTKVWNKEKRNINKKTTMGDKTAKGDLKENKKTEKQ